MTFMVWSEELETGIDIVDRQHRGLVDMLNQAAPILVQSSHESLQSAGPLLDGLLNYAAIHFRTEEELMARVGMDARARDHQHASHAGFGKQVGEMVQSFSQGLGVTGDRLLSFLASWLVLHILGEDQAMARQFRALQAGMPAAQAYAEARGDELQPSPAALSNTLVGVYTVLTRQNRELLLLNRKLDASRATVQRQNDNLEQLVRQRTVELEQAVANLRAAKDAAEAANRAKTRFLGTMSHELRTPMNAILGFSRLLHDQGLPAPQDVLARKIVDASDRLLLLLNGIIDYARLEGGGEADVRLAAFELPALLAEVSAAGFAAARAKGLQTSIDLDPGLPARLLGDARIIKRVLEHFISNAVKFTPQGAIRLSAAKVAAAGDGQVRLRFSVSDTGIGIPREIETQLFQPFIQADDGTDRKFEGIGLGLVLARELACVMGGDIGVASKPGQGSTFWLQLTLRVDDSIAPAPGSAGADAPAATTPKAPAAAMAVGPLPDPLRSTLQTLDALLCAYDTRAAEVLTQAAPGLRPWLGGRVDTLAGLIDAFDYDQACLLLKSLHVPDWSRHEH